MSFNFNRLAGILTARGGVTPVADRNFTDLVPAGNQYYTIPAVSLGSNDFTIEIDLSTLHVANASHNILSGSLSSEDTIIIDLRSSFLIRAFAFVGTTLQSIISVSSLAYTDGALHTLKLTYISSSGAVDLLIDGSSVGTATWSLNGSQTIANIGSRAASIEPFQGYLANHKITDNGIIIRNYAIDETWDGPSTVLVDAGTDSSNGTAVNITSSDSENFTFDGDVSPNTWTNDGATIVIDVAGT